MPFSPPGGSGTPQTSLTPWDRLPSLVLYCIAECLGSTKTDLLAFSLVNTNCAAASRPHRLERIRLSVPDEPEADTDRFREALERATAIFCYVRQVRLTRALLFPPQTSSDTQQPSTPELQWRAEKARRNPRQNTCIFEHRGQSLPWESSGRYRRVDNNNSPKEKAGISQQWMPLARFLGSLPRLADVVYAHTEPVPTCLLEMLHAKRPAVRLHVETFNLRSLHLSADEANSPIDPDEYMLATSPCLYSIDVRYSGIDDTGRFDFNKHAVMQMSSGLAPNLKSVSMKGIQLGSCIEIYQALQVPFHLQPQWKGLDRSGPDHVLPCNGHLRTLDTESFLLHEWSTVTNFKELTSLRLSDTDNRRVQSLCRLAQDDGLSSLTSLDLDLCFDSREDVQATDEETAILLGTLRPLRRILLGGAVADNAFQAVLESHGPSLEQFRFLPIRACRSASLPFSVTLQHIQRLRSNCASIEKLEITLPRTGGDVHEVNLYRELGGFRHLQSLSLRLDCSKRQPNELLPVGLAPQLGDGREVEELSPSSIRQALINCAVDWHLARSIFQVLSDGGARQLRTLKLEVANHDEAIAPSEDYELQKILPFIARSWVCERDWSGGTVHVQELSRETGDDDWLLFCCDILRKDFAEGDDFDARPDLMDIWTGLWPGPPGDRRDQWASFPLAGIK